MANKIYNFISGLPRSGSTLLTSILNQNPKFYSNISDPLYAYTKALIQETSSGVGNKALVNDKKLTNIIEGVFNSYYSDVNKEIIFNTNRYWTSDTAILNTLFNNKWKMLVCVREVPWILDSFEKIVSKSSYSLKPLYNYKDLDNVYDRSSALMGGYPEIQGTVMMALKGLSQFIASQDGHKALYIEYDALASEPEKVLKAVYEYLEEPYFKHDFNNVGKNYDDYDTATKIDKLHTVQNKVKFKPRKTILPIDLWNQYASQSFWKTQLINNNYNYLYK